MAANFGENYCNLGAACWGYGESMRGVKIPIILIKAESVVNPKLGWYRLKRKHAAKNWSGDSLKRAIKMLKKRR